MCRLIGCDAIRCPPAPATHDTPHRLYCVAESRPPRSMGRLWGGVRDAHMVRVGTASSVCHLSPVCTERDVPTSLPPFPPPTPPPPCTPDRPGVWWLLFFFALCGSSSATRKRGHTHISAAGVKAHVSWMSYVHTLISQYRFHPELKAQPPRFLSML